MSRHAQLFSLVMARLAAWMPLVTMAEQFEDVVATAQSFHSGDTYHGYCEFRVNLENRSKTSRHEIELVFPNQLFEYINGNAISRLSRTVVLDPGARAAVALWQPPLPACGDSAARLVVDGVD